MFLPLSFGHVLDKGAIIISLTLVTPIKFSKIIPE